MLIIILIDFLWGLHYSGVYGGFSTKNWLRFGGGDLFKNLRVAPMVGLFVDGAVAKQYCNVKKLHS